MGRVVYHSVLRPQVRSMPHHAAKDRVEEYLDGVRPGLAGAPAVRLCRRLDAALPQIADTGRFPAGLGSASTVQSLVDVRDVADAAAVLLTEDGLDGGTFEAVGPESLTAVPDRRSGGRAARPAGHPGRRGPGRTGAAGGGLPRPTAAGSCSTTTGGTGSAGSPRVLTALLGRAPRTFAEHLADVRSPVAPEPSAVGDLR